MSDTHPSTSPGRHDQQTICRDDLPVLDHLNWYLSSDDRIAVANASRSDNLRHKEYSAGGVFGRAYPDYFRSVRTGADRQKLSDFLIGMAHRRKLDFAELVDEIRAQALRRGVGDEEAFVSMAINDHCTDILAEFKKHLQDPQRELPPGIRDSITSVWVEQCLEIHKAGIVEAAHRIEEEARPNFMMRLRLPGHMILESTLTLKGGRLYHQWCFAGRELSFGEEHWFATEKAISQRLPFYFLSRGSRIQQPV